MPRLSIRTAVVVAHPDDETIGVGGQLPRFGDIVVVHVTDGAPRGHLERSAYARRRRRELETAMALAGIPARDCIPLRIVDQEASLQLARLTERLAGLFAERQIEIVLTQPYEGGHPDHDATAFAVHAARDLMMERAETPPEIIEMAFYHADRGGWCAQQFVRVPGVETIAVPLSAAAWALKQRMLSAHSSQSDLLAQFGASIERFRVAPAYDFCALPNDGAIYYEALDFGMTAARWRELASEARRELLGSKPRR